MADQLQVCPFCRGDLNNGFLWKHHGGQLMVSDGSFKWFDGELRKPSHLDTNIPVGEPGLMTVSVRGLRCGDCRKIILDY